MFGFIALAASVERHRYRTCEQAPYCKRNHAVGAQQWSISAETIKFDNYHFSANIEDKTRDIINTLSITFLRSQGMHIRISPASKEKFNRYQCSSEDIIIKQDVVNDLSVMLVNKTDKICTIRANSDVLHIQYKPFKMTFVNSNGNTVILNPDDNAIFEHNLPRNKYPDLYQPYHWGGHNDVYVNGPTSVAFNFRFIGPKTRISGLPMHTLPITLPETTKEMIRFFNSDINSFEIGNGMAMYAAIPFMYAHGANHSTGLFWANPSETWINISYQKDYVETRFLSEGGYIDFFLFGGDHQSIINQYTTLTGRPMLPPKFGLAFHQSRWGYMTQEDFIDVSRKLDNEHLPHDVLWLDLDHTDNRKYFIFHPNNFPDPDEMLREFDKSKRHVVVLIDPHLRAESSYHIYKEASDNKYTLRTKDGNEFIGNCWPGRSAWVDFLNPKAVNWWKSLFKFNVWKHASKNMHIWHDMNEISVFDSVDSTAPRDLVHYGGIEEREVHNIYGALMMAHTFDSVMRRSPEGERPFILTRSMFAGSQRYGFVWGGDNAASWEQYRSSLQLVLQASIAGFPLVGNDIGGFFDSPSDELLSKWFSYSAWLESFFREHCHHLAARREIYFVKDQKARDLIRTSVQERYQMLSYWYTLARESNLTGNPIVRPIWWEFDDEELIDEDSYAMLGPSLLVVPFFEPGTKNREIRMPGGRWYNYRSMEEIKNTRNIIVPYDNGRAAVFLRGGRIVPSKEIIRKSSKLMYYDPFTLSVGLDEDGKAEGKLYEDDGESFDFMKGKFLDCTFKFENNTLYSKVNGSIIDGYDVVINKIVISGLKEMPKSITHQNIKLEYSFDNGILIIRKPNLPIYQDWKLQFE